MHFGFTDNVRKVANLWASRLRNPDGNSKVPVSWRAPAWTGDAWRPEEWAMQIGKPYPDLKHAEQVCHDAILNARGYGMHVLNKPPRAVPGTLATVIREQARSHAGHAGGKRVVLHYPDDLPYEAQRYEWPVLLEWLLAANRCRNPTDDQVRGLWIAHHAAKGLVAPQHVHDPDRQVRRDAAERRRQYNRNALEVRQGKRPRTWLRGL